MKRLMKIILGGIGAIALLITIDLICIFTINRPLFAIQTDNDGSINNVYKGIFYDTYNCPEYSTPQIKAKWTKFTCAIGRDGIGKVIDIIDTTKDIKDFACAEALEEFYEDENFIYYFDCIKGKYMIVKYESGFEETIENALKYGTITINDLDNFDIDYLKEEKQIENIDKISKNVPKTRKIDNVEVDIINLASDLQAFISDINVSVIVVGDEDAVASIDPKQVKIVVDLQGYTKGEHTVKTYVKNVNRSLSYTIFTPWIKVQISDKNDIDKMFLY